MLAVQIYNLILKLVQGLVFSRGPQINATMEPKLTHEKAVNSIKTEPGFIASTIKQSYNYIYSDRNLFKTKLSLLILL